MFRLAELYYEKINDDYLKEVEDYDKKIKLFEEKKLAQEPIMPEKHFEKSIALYQRILKDFPDYRFSDIVYYLLGYCLGEQDKGVESKEAFLALVNKFPKSRFQPESWARIGEFYFDNNELDNAIAAYLKVLDFPDSVFYDKALYKLG